MRNENGRTKFVKKVEKSEVQGEILKPRLSSYKERGAKSFSQSSQEKIENESGLMSTHEKVMGKVKMSRHNGEEIEKMGKKSQNAQNSETNLKGPKGGGEKIQKNFYEIK